MQWLEALKNSAKHEGPLACLIDGNGSQCELCRNPSRIPLIRKNTFCAVFHIHVCIFWVDLYTHEDCQDGGNGAVSIRYAMAPLQTNTDDSDADCKLACVDSYLGVQTLTDALTYRH